MMKIAPIIIAVPEQGTGPELARAHEETDECRLS
jgi:hypothetical protein